MHGLADHLFGKALDVFEPKVAQLFSRNAGRFGYKYAYIAERDDELVGLLVACPGDKVGRLNLETIPHLISVLGFAEAIGFVYRSVMLPGGKEAENDEFFLGNIGILPSMQGRSLGTQLLGYAEELAHKNGLKKCSLIVGWGNNSARRLYERVGYEIAETVQDENENLGYYRMVKVL